jgi:hypothetical protein
LNDKDLEETSRHYAKIKEGECLLKVSDAKRCDTGTYKVALKNVLGTDYINVRVKVLGECLSLVCTLTVMCIIAVGHH